MSQRSMPNFPADPKHKSKAKFDPMPVTQTSTQSTVKLRIQLTCSSFVSGGPVSGRLELVRTGSTKCAVGIGQVYVNLIGSEEHTPAKFKWLSKVTKSSVFHTQKEELARTPLSERIGNSGPGYRPMNGYKTSFPFHIHLPTGIPSSFNSCGARIVYRINGFARIKVARGGQSHFLLGCVNIPVIARLVNIERPLSTTHPLIYQNRVNSSLIGRGGYVGMQCELQRGFAVSGSNVLVKVTLTNGTHKTSTGCKISLVQTIDVETRGVYERSIAKARRREVVCDPGERNSFIMDIIVPPSAISINESALFEVSYYLNVKVTVSFAKDLVVKVPLTIFHPSTFQPPQKCECERTEYKEEQLSLEKCFMKLASQFDSPSQIVDDAPTLDMTCLSNRSTHDLSASTFFSVCRNSLLKSTKSKRDTFSAALRDISNLSISLRKWKSKIDAANKVDAQHSLISVSSWTVSDESSEDETTGELSLLSSPPTSRLSMYRDYRCKPLPPIFENCVLDPKLTPRSSSVNDSGFGDCSMRLSKYMNESRLTLMSDLDGELMRRVWKEPIM